MGARVAISPYARKRAQELGVDPARVQGTGPGGRITAADVQSAAAHPSAPATPVPGKAEPLAAAAERPAPTGPPAVEPLAALVAERYRVDLTGVAGTGEDGRITVPDVMAARSGKPAPVRPPADEELPPLHVTPDEADVEEASFRLKTQARIVVASKHVIPHFYVTRSVDATALLARKAALKETLGATVTHLLLLACVRAIEKHPEVNRSYDRGKVIRWKGIHLGIAADTPDGLTVAVLHDAQQLSLREIVARSQALVEKARAGKLTAEERRHPTFTVTNLGMFDVEHFQPIINPPSAITLGVASAIEQPVVRRGGISIAHVMRLTASCDHRIVEGVHAAAFLRDLRDLLEDPDGLLAGQS